MYSGRKTEQFAIDVKYMDIVKKNASLTTKSSDKFKMDVQDDTKEALEIRKVEVDRTENAHAE